MASDADSPDDPPPPDPVIEAFVDAAMEPYKSLLPPEVLADFRDFVADALATHDIASMLVNQTRNRVPGSGEQVQGSSAEEAPELVLKGKTGGGRT